ncbi:HlyD family efflux transporter periplasmic adaptor subunit [Roseivirga echinicomitans]|uniref:HlyD family efflux transporter periplasmic adaptor subunit n=1 Tax=Roseivirga echinicomitans TaxID=296218 RepID=UPI0012FDDF0B|nr:HlyD family efflux transporter periplasmic adaptor subunit [Roseivirga echinicomitans]
MISIIVGAALISYDDVVPARVTVTSLEPPVYIRARSSGKISHIFAKPDKEVEKNEILAIIENTAEVNDVLWVKDKITKFQLGETDLDSLNYEFPLTLSLGEVQRDYYQFIAQCQNYLLYQKNQPNQVQAELIADQIIEQQTLLKKQNNQLQLFKEELELSLVAYQRNVSLLDSSVISTVEFERGSRAYLGDKQRFESLQMQIANTQISISSLNGNKTRLLLSDEEIQHNNLQLLKEGIQNLKNAIASWEQSYVIESPIAGKVTLFDIWTKYQNVDAGTVLFTVVPEEIGSLIGKVVLPVQNSGKVKVGQRVIIKIDNYPQSEWGSLSGLVVNISSVPKQGLAEYSVQVNIDSLTTSFGKTMEFKQEMQGSAEIVTEELTVLQRIFYQLRKVIGRN